MVAANHFSFSQFNPGESWHSLMLGQGDISGVAYFRTSLMVGVPATTPLSLSPRPASRKRWFSISAMVPPELSPPNVKLVLSMLNVLWLTRICDTADSESMMPIGKGYSGISRYSMSMTQQGTLAQM